MPQEMPLPPKQSVVLKAVVLTVVMGAILGVAGIFGLGSAQRRQPPARAPREACQQTDPTKRPEDCDDTEQEYSAAGHGSGAYGSFSNRGRHGSSESTVGEEESVGAHGEVGEASAGHAGFGEGAAGHGAGGE